MATFKITCISRDGPDPDYRIDAAGFSGNVYPIDQIVRWIQNNDHQFYVSDDRGDSIWVGVRQHPTSGRFYLATEPDGNPLNNLKSLPECP